MLNEHDPFNAYKQTSINARAAAANPHEMVRMLLDGLLEEIQRAAGFMQRKSFEEKGQSINKCLNIVHGLDSMLDLENGSEVATKLNQLYDYCSRQLVIASVENSTTALIPITKVITDVRAGWANLN
ncbi:flagellar export chaperone FliS [Shewanella fidelis]|uniref:Flagellar secretion chaperone FliS n=1 Tax=Shewanella fidelis TaxID=173509 RepID=A0AAW8NTL0_9GAMM|nr:flagellar export chaperone FliS [Shewanella fidelis]MDR8525906.1 flagellar export chaperone FliS [Shewanella fidelis]MDW4813906.1 flagellar export chaperone FliS [Shewanella fidelis]MDW4817902.1 flagellar export chaperone FliS [Shewanella fidelis]MDW4821969.1 flagellar export chaperone FliS [Shewanella fidelis]MDW4826134.1 flagellar export chaperone FliS [Shewanella fidelis]